MRCDMGHVRHRALSEGDESSILLLKPVAVEAREGFKIWLSFNDGVEGEIDVSDVVDYEVVQTLAGTRRV